MATVVAIIDGGWSALALTFVACRDGTQLGAEAATNAQLASGQWTATATIDMSGYGAGVVDLSLIDGSSNLAWLDQQYVDAAGNLQSQTVMSTITTITCGIDGNTIWVKGLATGLTLYAYPTAQSLADWTTYRVLLTEGTGADAGRYVGSADPANGTSLVLFSGATQPASWADAVVGVGWDLLIAAIKADPQLGTADGGLVANAATAATQATAAPAATVAAIKADADLGTASGGLVANAAAVASAATEARLAELDAANIPTDLTTVKAKTDLIGTIRSLIRW